MRPPSTGRKSPPCATGAPVRRGGSGWTNGALRALRAGTAELLHQAEAVDHLPVTGDLPANDVVDRLTREAQPLPGRRQAHEVARVRALGAPADADAMFRGDEVVDGESQVGEACPRIHHPLAISRTVERLPFPGIAGVGVDDVPRRHQPINSRQLAGAPDDVVQLADDT